MVHSELDNVECNLEHGNNGDGDGHDGNEGWMNGAASNVCYNSKRVRTKTLATEEASQHRRRNQKMAYVPRHPTPSSKHPRHPTHDLNLPRR